ncbi:MAG: hypothetical protein IT324_19600 [Anaerolineae bacterium]|nr:hypothetical protein [Anaerolineae bacterium]
MPKRKPKPNKAQVIREAQAQLETVLGTLRPLASDDAWATAYIIPTFEDLIDSRNNPYNPSLATWLANIDED